jgi:hypothetical protein
VILTLSSFISNSSGLAAEDEAGAAGDELLEPLLEPEGMLKECQPPLKNK